MRFAVFTVVITASDTVLFGGWVPVFLCNLLPPSFDEKIEAKSSSEVLVPISGIATKLHGVKSHEYCNL